jgi:hypothetical protein
MQIYVFFHSANIKLSLNPKTDIFIRLTNKLQTNEIEILFLFILNKL